MKTEILFHTVASIDGSRMVTPSEIAKLSKIPEGGVTPLPEHVVIDEHYVHTDNNLTNELKEKIESGGGGPSYCQITFMNNTEVVAVSNVKQGDVIVFPPLTDVFLEGWYTDEALTKPVIDGYICAKSETLYAKVDVGEPTIFRSCIGQIPVITDKRLGPTKDQCLTLYRGTLHSPKAIDMFIQGVQEWKVPSTGTYHLKVAAGHGGDAVTSGIPQISHSRNGQLLQGEVDLTRGEVLQIVVGGNGLNAGDQYSWSISAGGGGGGASFVKKKGEAFPLIVAGGGLGAGERNIGTVFSSAIQTSRIVDPAPIPNEGLAGPNEGGCWTKQGSRYSSWKGESSLVSGSHLNPVTDGDASGGRGNVWSDPADKPSDLGADGGFGGGGGGGADGGASGGGYQQLSLSGYNAYSEGRTGMGYCDPLIKNRQPVTKHNLDYEAFIEIRRVK